VTSLRNCDMKLSIKKSCFIHDFISTLDDGASTSAKKIWPLHSSMGGSHTTRLSFLPFDFVSSLCLILFQWLAKDATSILWDEAGIRPTLLWIGTVVMGHKSLWSRATGSPLLNHRYSDNTVATSRRWSSLLWPLVATTCADVIRPSLLGPQ
jgi:hypothetical protein